MKSGTWFLSTCARFENTISFIFWVCYTGPTNRPDSVGVNSDWVPHSAHLLYIAAVSYKYCIVVAEFVQECPYQQGLGHPSHRYETEILLPKNP